MEYETNNLALNFRQVKSELVSREESSRVEVRNLYRRRRPGIPHGFCNREKHSKDIAVAIKTFNKDGYGGKIPDLDLNFEQHLYYFRACLDVYYTIIGNSLYEKNEMYIRCLSEGVNFTKEIKKTRSLSLIDKTSIEELDLDETFVSKRYWGYDCIMAEKYLINWDDSEETCDWPYSLLELDPIDEEKISKAIKFTFKKYAVNLDILKVTKLIEPLANKRSVKFVDGEFKTTALKNTYFSAEEGYEYFALRRVVPTEPGKTRDTGVPTADCLKNLKKIQIIARVLAEQIPRCANCNFETLNKRTQRLKMKGGINMHLDFKKFGLTAPRELTNTLLEVINRNELRINDFYLHNGEELLRTNRGTVLGWFDPLLCVIIMCILEHLRARKNWKDMSFIGFNDDIEINFSSCTENEAILRKIEIIEELESLGLIISHRKTYLSRSYIFLEEYNCRDGKYDDKKLQMAVLPYAKSLVSPFSWEAKTCFADGWDLYKNFKLKELCFNSIIPLFGEIEYEKPVELGGWTRHWKECERVMDKPAARLNNALEDASLEELNFFYKMRSYKPPRIVESYDVINMDDLRGNIDIAIAESTKRIISKESPELSFDKKDEYNDEYKEYLSSSIPRPREDHGTMFFSDSDSEEEQEFRDNG